MPRDMKKDWWFKFEHLAWLTDEQLNRCSLETQGFWIRSICIMHKGATAKLAGTEVELARLLSVTVTEFRRCVAELTATKTAGVTQTAKIFTLVSRKFAKELKVREQNRLRKRHERSHAPVTDESQRRVISKSKEIEVREDSSESSQPSEPERIETPKQKKPPSLPTSVESEINYLLDAVAPLTGAKSRQTMANPKRWREVVEIVVKEQHEVPQFLGVVKNELNRNKGTPQFFTPEGCLKVLQSQQIKSNNGFTH